MLYVLTTFFVCLNERRFETSPLLLACSLENFPDYRAKFTAERGKPRGAPNLFGPEYDYYSTPPFLWIDQGRLSRVLENIDMIKVLSLQRNGNRTCRLISMYHSIILIVFATIPIIPLCFVLLLLFA